MDPKDMFIILRKRSAIILLIPALAIATAWVSVFHLMRPIYESSTTLLVGKAPSQSPLVLNDIMLNRQLVKTYRIIAHSNTVMEQVISDLALPTTADKLRSSVDISLLGDTEVIQIRAQDEDPVEAMVIANAVAEAFMVHVVRIMEADNVVVIDHARLPMKPVKPQKKLIISLAGLLGLMISSCLALILECIDNTIKTSEDVSRHLNMPVLGIIPEFDSRQLDVERSR